MKYLTPAKITKPKGYVVEGSTMTIPNLAPSLIEIIACSSTDGFPLVGTPMYDESESAGLARIEARRKVLSDIQDFGKANELTTEEGPSLAPRKSESSLPVQEVVSDES